MSIRFGFSFFLFTSLQAYGFYDCELNESWLSLEPTKRYQVARECDFEERFISKRTLVNSLTVEVTSLPSESIRKSELKSSKVPPFEMKVMATKDCKTIKCLQNKAKEKLVERYLSKNQRDETGKALSIDFSIHRVNLKKNTPLFKKPPTGDYSLPSYYNMDDNYPVFFEAEYDENGELVGEVPFEFDKVLPSRETHYDLDEVGFSEEEILEIKTKYNGKVPDSSDAEVFSELNKIEHKVEPERNQKGTSEIILLKRGGKEYKFELHREENQETIFTISDGVSKQKFMDPFIKTLLEFPESIGEIKWSKDTLVIYDADFSDIQISSSEAVGELSLIGEEGSESKNSFLERCLIMLNDFFNNKDFEDKQIQQFLSIQLEITISKLSHLKGSQTQQMDLKQNILALMKQKYNKKSSPLANEFDKLSPSSLRAIQGSLSHLMSDLQKQVSTESSGDIFTLRISDLKTIEIVNALETNKMMDNQVGEGYFRIKKLLNNSYSNSKRSDLKKDIANFNERQKVKLKEIIYQACFESNGDTCRENIRRVNNLVEPNYEIFFSNIMNNIFHKTDEVYILEY